MLMYRVKQPPITAWKFNRQEVLTSTTPPWLSIRVWASEKGGVRVEDLRFTIDGQTEVMENDWVVFDGYTQKKFSETEFVAKYEIDPAPKPIETTATKVANG